MSEKLVGYVLLGVGVAAILFSVLNVYQVFTKKVEPINLFSFESVSLDFSKFADQAPADADFKQELVSSDKLNKPLNIAAHLFFMGFVASTGFKLASLGTQLLHTIKVELKEKEVLEKVTSQKNP